MRVFSRLVFVALILTLVAGPALAQGNIARVTYWTLKPGTEAQFAAGIKAHNQLHARNNDPVSIFTGFVVSGHHQGEVVRGSLGHSWADFDAEGGGMDSEDAADMAIHVDPYIESARTVFYAHIPELSRSKGAPAAMARVIYFHLHSAHAQAFREAVAKAHAALEEQEEWPPYDWYRVADGGKQPTMVLVLPRDSWAGFEPRDEMDQIMSDKYGDEAADIWATMAEATASRYSHTIAFPAELAYTPSGD